LETSFDIKGVAAADLVKAFMTYMHSWPTFMAYMHSSPAQNGIAAVAHRGRNSER
jgi:hypothetical protein